MTMGRHDLRLVEGTFNEEEGTQRSCFRAGRLTAVSPHLKAICPNSVTNREGRVIEVVHKILFSYTSEFH